MSDTQIKRERVLSILDSAGANSVQLASAAAISWYLDGAATHVSLAAGPIVAVEVSRSGDRVLLTSNESERLVAEQLPAGSVLEVRDWFAALPAPVDRSEAQLDAELRAARQKFLPGETERYRLLGEHAAIAMTDALSTAEPSMSERALAAVVTQRLVESGADPLVVLVGGEHRPTYRHPLPTDAAIGRRAIVTVCARRSGLIVNLSRWLRFGAETAEERDSEARIRLVEADVFAATRPGATLAEVLAVAAESYPRHGFDAEEWTRHHQGGAAGYAGRDARATPDAADRIVLGQHFAWNPTALGAKIEDTVVLSTDGISPITVDARWPTTMVAGRARPVALEL